MSGGESGKRGWLPNPSPQDHLTSIPRHTDGKPDPPARFTNNGCCEEILQLWDGKLSGKLEYAGWFADLPEGNRDGVSRVWAA